MITVKNADKALKDYYLDAVSMQLNGCVSPFFSAIEKNSDDVFGKDVRVAIVRGNNGSIAAGSEDGDLPAPYTNRRDFAFKKHLRHHRNKRQGFARLAR